MNERMIDCANGRQPGRVLYVSKNDGSDSRISKECLSLAAAGYEVVFVGWDRTPGSVRRDAMPGIEKRVIVLQSQIRSPKGMWHLLRYYLFLATQLVKLRPHYVHAVNEDLAFLVLPFKPILGFTLICDIFDSYSLRYARARFPVDRLSAAMCRLTWHASDVLLATDETRARRLAGRGDVRIVANYPVDPGRQVADIARLRAGAVWLYVAGTLYRERGLAQLIDLLERDNGVRILSAGWIRDALGQSFVEHPRVEYLGVIPPDESLCAAASCHAVVALYNPANVNNVLASPNKLYDAMCIGRPVIMNREAHVSAWVASNNLGYTFAYGDVAALATIVERLRALGDGFADEASRIRASFEHGYSWQRAEREMLAAYETLSSRHAPGS